MGRAKRWAGGEWEPFPPLSVVVHHLAVATWMMTKPLMSEKWELTRSTCSCLGPLLEGVMLNWTTALSWGSRLRTLGKGERRKVDHQLPLIPASPWLARALGIKVTPCGLTFKPYQYASSLIFPSTTSHSFQPARIFSLCPEHTLC